MKHNLIRTKQGDWELCGCSVSEYLKHVISCYGYDILIQDNVYFKSLNEPLQEGYELFCNGKKIVQTGDGKKGAMNVDAIIISSNADLASAICHMHNILRHRAIDKGVIMQDPATVYFSYDTEVDEGVIIEAFVSFGKGVKIAKGSRILSFCYIVDTSIGCNVSVGPFAHIRQGSDLQENVDIGNFVEIKKSVIGQGTKAKHLCYIGDAEVGRKVNFGAGVITCNYDGINKHKTIVKDYTMLGSNVALIAPVMIGKGAFVAAGSVINKTIEDYALAAARVQQKNLKNKSPMRKKCAE